MYTKAYNKRQDTTRKKMETTLRLKVQTKEELDKFKQYKNESYDELIRKLIYIAKLCENEPKLSQKTIKDIKEARERVKKREFYTEAEAKKILGI
ncbi:MAG: hypothetical protein AABX03_04930 [Nanoarchaeota archaeon]